MRLVARAYAISFQTQTTEEDNEGNVRDRTFRPAMCAQPVYTTFDAPGAGTTSGAGTFATNINGGGTIVGYTTGMSDSGSFVRDPDGTFTSFNPPGATAGSTAAAINNAGDVAGNYYNGDHIGASCARRMAP